MTVYIEYAIAENFTLDFTLLYLAVKTSREKISMIRIFFSALCGTAFAVIYPLLTLPDFAGFALKFLFGAAMCLFSFKRGKIKSFLSTVFFFYVYTFCLGGALTAIYSYAEIEYEIKNGYVVSPAPIGLVLSFSVAFFVFGLKFVKKAFARIKLIKRSCKCRLKLNGSEIEEYALMDSGNMLSFNGNPVSIVSLGLAARLMGDFSGRTEAVSVQADTVNGTGSITVFRIDEMEIYFDKETNKIEGAYLGISRFLGKECPLILNSSFIRSGGNV